MLSAIFYPFFRISKKLSIFVVYLKKDAIKDIHNSKEKLLSMSAIDVEKKGIVVAWYDSVVKLLESIKTN
jgi:hypothetical protein